MEANSSGRYDGIRRRAGIAFPTLRSVLLVAVTGWGQADERAKSRDAGIALHLVKPLDFGLLAKELSSMGLPE
ncbi:hypothetical protein LJR296_006796 [Cupriavidus necator]|uniref:hypothetical protein n=1 Tax=Cupriavidus necator TaxID=106590 RepID=UPI003ECDAC59